MTSGPTAIMTDTDTDMPEHDHSMTFVEHLQDLRTALIRALLGIVPCMAIAWYYKEQLLGLLVKPLSAAYKQLGFKVPALHFANPIDPFLGYLKLSFTLGLILASPWVFYQVWRFVSPGLYNREKRLVFPFVLASTAFFAGGAFFGYLVVFPLGFETFLSFAGYLPHSGGFRIEPTIMMSEYLEFITQMLLGFGVVFEIPVIITFLALAGIVNWKQLLKFSRWWLLLSSIIAAILTPPDVGSQMLMLVPMVALYFISVGIAYLVGRAPTKTA